VSKVGTIILDFDGVLAESNQAKSRAFEDFFTLYPSFANAMRAYHLNNYATSRMAKFEHYVDKLMNRPGDNTLVDMMADQFSEIVKQVVIAAPDVLGAREFLHEFSQQVPLYISSVTPQDELKEIVKARGIDAFLTDVFGNPPVKKVGAIQTILSREGLLPSQAVFIGDSVSDYQVAEETGVIFFGRDSGFGFEGTQVHLFNDLFDIAEELRKRMKGKK